MYIVKHIPTGKYIKKTRYNVLWELNNPSMHHYALTDDINKARIYRLMSHITSSLGTQPIIKREMKEVVEYGGKKVIKEVIIYGETRVNPEVFEVIEMEMNIK